MDINPLPSLLEAMRSQALSWKDIVGELIDNSLDAGASQIELSFGPKNQFRIKDNGTGCADIESMLVMGKHIRHSTTKLGRFGIGLKDAACCLWGETCIDSIHAGTKYSARIKWASLAQQEDWTTPDAISSNAGNETGTTITFRNISKNLPQSSYVNLQAEIEYTFMPALLGGRQIAMTTPRKKNILCRAYDMPMLTHVVEDEFDVGGRRVKLRAGIVQDYYQNKKPGFSFIHEHRVICCSAVGANGMNVERVAGTVYLDRKWRLSKNKTELVDDQKRLGEAIFVRCKDMLEDAHRQAAHIESEQFNADVAKRLNEAIAAIQDDSKEKRGAPKNESGTVQPSNSGTTRKRARKRKPGDKVLEVLIEGNFQLSYRLFDTETVGEVDLPGRTIWLNENNLHLSHLRTTGNSDATFDVALGLLVYSIESAEQGDRFPFMRDTEGFLSGWARIMCSVERRRATTANPVG